MRKPFTEQIHDHLKAGVTMCGSAYKFAKESGVQLPTLGRWLDGTQPRLAAVAPVMDYLGAQIVLPSQEVQTYTPPLQLSQPSPEEADRTAPADILPRIRESWHGKPDMLFLPKIMDSLGLKQDNALLFRMEYDSMAPLLHKGDHVLIDTSKRRLDLEQGIYLFFSGGKFMIRRLYRTPEHIVLVDESNRSEQKVSPDIIEVLGKIVWIGKRL